MRRFEITYWPYATGFIRFYGAGCMAGAKFLLAGDIIEPKWYDWILFLGKYRIVKFGNKKHRISFVDYNMGISEFFSKLYGTLTGKCYRL